jgi:hypothetical protein
MGYYYTLEGRRYREGTDHHYLIVELSPIVPSKVATAHRKYHPWEQTRLE